VNESKLSANIFAFDSMRLGCYTLSYGYGCVQLDAIDWFRKTSIHLKEKHKRIIPSVSFVHIPPPEIMTRWYSRTCYGTNNESICCQSQNTGLISTIFEQKNIKVNSILFELGRDCISDMIIIMIFIVMLMICIDLFLIFKGYLDMEEKLVMGDTCQEIS
jgi:hypothetical protein